MSQDLARIRAFVQVFDAGGFSSAARQHGRSKALLSKYVTDLEDYLGVPLVERQPKRVALTATGVKIVQRARLLLQEADARRAPGLLHKYRGRALLVATGACAMHCRYCFRREFPYEDQQSETGRWHDAIAALAAARESIVACHGELQKDHRRLGFGTYAAGPIGKPDDWLDVPERFLPVAEAARG